MIQLNLLPDVKLEYIKAQKLRSLVTGISVVVSAVAIVILVILLAVDFAQKGEISSAKSKVAIQTSELQGKPNIDTILTVQNQLESLSGIYAQRPDVSRLFSTYLDEITPATISLNDLQADFTENTVTLTGNAANLTIVNQYVDTLKATTYTVGNSKVSAQAFKDVVLSTFGYDSAVNNPNLAASFTITLDFSPTIFNVADNVKLTVPNIAVTRSETQNPGDLFSAASATGGQ